MKIAVVGTGYVGLVTGVCLSEVGHRVTCVDVNEEKVQKMRDGLSPIYEPGLDELMLKNIEAQRLFFSTQHKEAFEDADVIYIAVGTPQNEDGSANLIFIEQVAKDIAANISKDVIVVTKSTVPVGTNDFIYSVIKNHLAGEQKVTMVSNPEFLREGSAIQDTFHGDRIVIGSECQEARTIMEQVYKPFGIPIQNTDIHSAEMIKYASNAFLATKISFINEIANLCELLGADIQEVSKGMGLDKRIGDKFLNAGIGYGGSCFPKDTSALLNMAESKGYNFDLIESVINVNNNQQKVLLTKAKERLHCFKGKNIALLGLAFKPNTDDMRDAPSIVISDHLVNSGATVYGYDPVAIHNAKKILPKEVIYTSTIEEAVENADAVFILTEWKEVLEMDLTKVSRLMKESIIFDGRNCYELDVIERLDIEYHSIGRKSVNSNTKNLVASI
jgi:UDPglucose 6-dehydrogenase